MAVPKRKPSKARKRKRRSHLAISPRQLTKCSRCRQPKLPHHVCGNCGYYKQKQVIEPEKI